MSDQGPSIADIQAARNQKLAAESSTDSIARELEGAHQEALALKQRLRDQGEEPGQQQAFPHGSVLSGGSMGPEAETKEHTSTGEKMAEGIASTDQSVTRAVRDGVHRLSEGVSAAGAAAGNAAGAAVDKTKEALQGAMGSNTGADGGRTTTGYEGAVFSSDDPDYKAQKSDGGAGVTESRTPAHTLDELKGSSGNPTIATPMEERRWVGPRLPGSGRWPVIASPKEPASLEEGSVGVAAGDPAGGANVVAAAHTAGKGVMASIKDAFSGTSAKVAGAPAGPSDTDPRTSQVPVGDFRALHEALGIAAPTGSTVGHGHHGGSHSSGAEEPQAAADVSRGTTDQDNASALPSSQQVKEGWEGVKGEVQKGLGSAAESAQQGLDAAAQRVQEAVGADTNSSGGTSAAGGGGILGGLAGIVSGIATKVNLANSSEELMAGGTVPDAAPGPAAADGATAAPAPEATAAADAAADTAAKARDAVSAGSSDAAAAAKDAAAGAADRVKQGAGDLMDKASQQASSAADSVKQAGASVRDAASGAAERAGDAAAATKQTAADEASLARDKAAEAAGAAGAQASDAAGAAKESAGGALSSLLQGAKEGFVGAYDAAASALHVGDNTPSSPTPASGDSSGPPAAAQPPSNVAGAGEGGLQSGAVGSGHAAAPNAGIGAVLKQGWEDLKHGGAKAPHATSTGGETAAAYDVTSNVERSKHLDDQQQAKIYQAETYSVSPGAQAASDQAATDASNAWAVAGDKRPVTGTVPHDKPDTSKVHAGQKTRFDGDKGMGSGFGTGSAAPWRGDSSIKEVSALFTSTTPHNSLDMGGLGPEAQAAVAQAGSGAERAGSSSSGAGGVRSWVSSMSAVWRGLGVASAKGPLEGTSIKEAKESIQWDSPTQDAVIDPVRGVTKKEGHSPGHKIQMRTSEQHPPDTDPSDPQFYKDKVERLGKVIKDTATTSSEEAAADPNNLKGKSSDNRPDGLAYYTKLEAQSAADAVGRAPEAATSALGTAVEIVTGAAGHVVDKTKELGSNIVHHGDFLSPQERTAKSQAAVERAEKAMERMGDVVNDHSAVQELQEERMAAIPDNPAHKRETLGDMVIGPLVKDASDDTHARELAASYNEWKHEKEQGTSTSQPPEASDSAAAGSGGGSGGSSTSVGAAVQDAGQEAKHTAQSAKEVVKMEGEAAGRGMQQAADKATDKAGGAIASVKGLATEAADTARAAGEVVSKEVAQAADAITGTADKAATRASDAAGDAKHSAQDTAQRAGDSARDTADRAQHSAKDAAQRTGDSLRDAASRAGDKTREAAGAAQDTASRAGDGLRDTAHRAGEVLQEGVDAVAEGPGYAAGAGAERLSEAQEAAARAGEKAGATAGGVLSSVGDAAKGLLGALLGPFEREGAFDESTAALTGPPKDFEPVGAEQLSGTPAAAPSEPQAPAVKRAPTTSSTAAAPAGADTPEDLRARVHDTKEGIKARLQAGLEDTARAAGLTAGHIESTVEGTVEAAKQQLAAAQEKAAQVTENIQVPPAEIPTNTQELLRQRQAQLQQ